MSIRTNALKVQAFAGALYGVQVGTTTMAQVNADITSGGFTNTINSYYASSFGNVANATVAASVAANLGLTGSALTAGTAYVEAQLNAAAPGARGAVISNILDLFAGLASDATFGAAATAWNAKVDAANAYTGAANVAIGSTVGQGSSFTLSTNADSFIGTAADETFNASLGRADSTDYLDGGAGTDTANLSITGSSDSPVMDRIETINATVYGDSTLAGALISGATAVNVDGGAVLTYSDADGESFRLSGAATGLTVNAAATTDTNTQSITINLASGALGTVTLGEASGSKTDFDVINLVAGGAASVTLTETSGDFIGTDESVVVTGASDLVLTIDDAALTAGTLTATAHTGQLTLDIVNIAASSNFDATKVLGVDVLRAGVDDNTISGLTSGMTVRFDVASGGSDQTIAVAGSSTSDTLTLSLNHGTAGSSVTTGVVTATGIESFTIQSAGTNTSTSTVTNTLEEVDTTTANSRLLITGSQNLTIGNGVSGADADFTTILVSNTATTNITLETGGQVSVTGGDGNDRIEFDTVADLAAGDALVGGAGVDTLAFSAVAATDLSSAQRGYISGFEILEYEGAQDIDAASGDVTIDLATEGFSTLFINGTLTTTVDGSGDLTVVALSGNTIRMGASATSGGSGEQELIVSMTGADAANSDVLNLQLTDAGSGDYTNAGMTASGVETLNISVLGDQSGALTDRDDVITISDFVDANLQHITIRSANTGNTAGTLVSDSLTITAVSGSLVTTFDASAFTGNLIITGMSGSFIATNTTITGGSGVDSIAGGSGSDRINGGAGADSLDGNAGADVINGGTGADTITGDSGADTIDGGTGVDVITGGTGNDVITTGDGADILHFAVDSTDTVTDFVHGIGGDVIDFSSLGIAAMDSAVILADAADGTLRVVAATSTAAVVFTDETAIGVSVATYAALDTEAEILALFGAGKAIEAVANGEEALLLVAAADTGHTYVWQVDDNGGTETATLVGILTGVDSTEVDAFRTVNFQA
jgi:hypothetical protein